MKDKTFPEMTIKIDLVREVKKLGKGSFEYKDKMYLVEIKYPFGRGIAFGVKAGKTRLRKVFKRIQEEIY